MPTTFHFMNLILRQREVTDLLEKPSNQRTPKKRHKNTRTYDQDGFGKKPWITLQDVANKSSASFLKLHGSEYWGLRPRSLGNFEQFSSLGQSCAIVEEQGNCRPQNSDANVTVTTDKPASSLEKRKCLYMYFTSPQHGMFSRSVTYFLSDVKCHVTNDSI